jgi:hypothetical protein
MMLARHEMRGNAAQSGPSRRDLAMVARYEMPGKRTLKRPVPEGTV